MKTPVVLALDIGGTNLRLATVAKDGTVTARSQSLCRINAGRTAFLTAIKTEIDCISSCVKGSGQEVIAVGAGVPGLIASNGTVLSSVNLKDLDGFNLTEWLTASAGLPTVTINDANAAAVAEQSYGAGRRFGSLLHFTLGTGVGSGLILDNGLWTGVDGVAAEYGHTTVEPQGVLCQCGNYGCLEQYASAPAIARAARESVESRGGGLLAEIPGESLDAAGVAAAAYRGDPDAIKCFSEAGRYLGIAAAAAVNLLNLEAVILGGGVAASFDLILPAMRSEVDKRAFAITAARVNILKGELGDNAGIMGAAAAAWKFSA